MVHLGTLEKRCQVRTAGTAQRVLRTMEPDSASRAEGMVENALKTDSWPPTKGLEAAVGGQDFP
jgi:hypothetical protein